MKSNRSAFCAEREDSLLLFLKCPRVPHTRLRALQARWLDARGDLHAIFRVHHHFASLSGAPSFAAFAKGGWRDHQILEVTPSLPLKCPRVPHTRLCAL